MTGAVIAGVGVISEAGSSGVVVPSPALVWAAIYGNYAAFSNTQTIAGITSPISLTASIGGGSGALLYSLNGTIAHYTGAFTVHTGDVLGWGIGGAGAGTITVTNVSDAGATLATISYVVTIPLI